MTQFPALLLALLSLLAAMPASAKAVNYRFDPVHSQLLFFADHMGFSRSIGRFTRWQGEFSYDPDNASANRVDVSIDIDSLELGDTTWNRTLLGGKWFNAAKYPQAHFVSERFEAGASGQAIIHGQLTLRGVTAKVDLHLRINRQGIHPYTLKYTSGFSASATLSRSAFGMDALKGTLADTVELKIEVEGQRVDAVHQRPRKR